VSFTLLFLFKNYHQAQSYTTRYTIDRRLEQPSDWTSVFRRHNGRLQHLIRQGKQNLTHCSCWHDKQRSHDDSHTDYPAQFVEKHAENIFPGNGISITNLNILPKTVYDRGDFDRIILLNETSIVEKVFAVCSEYHFIPDTTRNQFTERKYIYPIRTIGAVVTLARKVGSWHILHIKDGDSDNDKVTIPFIVPIFVLCFRMLIYLSHLTQLLNCYMLQLQLFDTYAHFFPQWCNSCRKGNFQ